MATYWCKYWYTIFGQPHFPQFSAKSKPLIMLDPYGLFSYDFGRTCHVNYVLAISSQLTCVYIYIYIIIYIYICNVALDPTRLYIHHGWFNHFNPHLSWLNPAISQFFALSYIVSELLFPPKNLLVLSREWMGCWGLLGWLLLVMTGIIPENSLLSTSKKIPPHPVFHGAWLWHPPLPSARHCTLRDAPDPGDFGLILVDVVVIFHQPSWGYTVIVIYNGLSYGIMRCWMFLLGVFWRFSFT